MARLRKENPQIQANGSGHVMRLRNEIDATWQGLLRILTPMRNAAVPITLALLLITVASFGAFNILSPSPALASQCTLSILSGDVEVQEPGAGNWKQGTDGMTLAARMRIKTSAESHALLTFFEGSTIKLEPGTDIEIQRMESGDEQATTIVLKQWMGRTWSRVIKMADPGSHYEIETPSANAIVRGTLFATEVGETGDTKVATTEGLVSVVAQDEEVFIPADQETQVAAGRTPSQPAAAPDPEAEITITIDKAAVASVIDPTGASTGYLPDGWSFNQIPGSQTSSLSGDTQTITIPQPTSGEYTIALRYITEDTAHINIQGTSEDEVAFEYTGTYEGAIGDGWLIRVYLNVEDGLIVDGDVSAVEPLEDKMPEKLVKVKSVPVATVVNKGGQPGKSDTPTQTGKPNQVLAKELAKQDEENKPDRAASGDQDKGTSQGNDNSNSQGNDNSNSQGNDNSQSQGNDNSQSQGNDNSNGQGNDNSNGASNTSGTSNTEGSGDTVGTGDTGSSGNTEGSGDTVGAGDTDSSGDTEGSGDTVGAGDTDSSGDTGDTGDSGDSNDNSNSQGNDNDNGQGNGNDKSNNGNSDNKTKDKNS